MTLNVKCAWQTRAELGEGPLWVARENALYWVDIIQKQVHRLSLADGSQKTWQFATPITSLAARAQGGFVCTMREGFAFVDLDTDTLEPIALPEPHLPSNRFNDGKVDPHGRYWAGSMDNEQVAASGSLYRLDPDHSLHHMDSGYTITNGPAFSADGRTLYHTDSVARVIYAFDWDAQGALANKRVWVRLTEAAEGAPDGMTVDSEGCVWLCHFGGARLTRYAPTGEVLQVVPLPVPNVTSCTFAGAGLDTLYITTAVTGLTAAEREKYPLAGSLFSYQPGVRGLPTPYFAG